MRPAPSSSSPVNRGKPTKSSGSASGHETTRNTCQRHYVRRCSVNLESIPSKLEATSAVLRQQPCKLNPCPIVRYVLALTKAQGKGTLALPEILPKLLITSWQRKDVWKTLFQNKSSGPINLVYLPQTTPEQYKERVNQNTVNHISCPQFLSCSL